MKTKLNLLMWSKNSVPLALEIDGSPELAYYVKRIANVIVYKHSGKFFAVDTKDLHVKTNRDH